MKAKNLTRDSSFEVLRIVSMFLIIGSHAAFDIGTPFIEGGMLAVLSGIFAAGGKVGAGLFFMINGYFLFSPETVNGKRLISIETKSIFISYLFLLIAVAINSPLLLIIPKVDPVQGLSFLDPLLNSKLFGMFNGVFTSFFFRGAFPTLSFEYWFISDYIIIELLRPWLYRHLSNRKKLRNAILILFLAFILVPTIMIGFGVNIMMEPFISFLFYLLGAYFQGRKKEESSTKSTICLLGGLFSFILIVFSLAGLLHFGSPFLKGLSANANSYDNVLPLISAACFFLFAFYHKPFYSKQVNFISSLVFYAYLFSGNVLVRTILFSQLFPIASWVGSPFLPLILFLSTLIPFVVSLALGFLLDTFISRFEPFLSLILLPYSLPPDLSSLSRGLKRVYE